MVHAKRSSSCSPKAQKLLTLSAHYLRHRDFSFCRKFALKARESDPHNSGADQILAVADVLFAADHQNPTDWCSILQIPPPGSENPTLVRTQFEKLKTLLEPSKNGFAFAQEAFELVQKAWSFLSDQDKKTHFANGSENGQETPKQREQREKNVGENGKGCNVEETFWTVCPYCYYMFEYGKVYEDCCLRCQNCRKAFHGVAIKAPSPDIIVQGKEQYNFCFGYFQMEYMHPKKQMETEVIGKKDKDVVVISDDDDGDDTDDELEDDLVDGNVGFEGMHEEKIKIGSEGVVGTDIGGSGRAELRSEGKTPVKRVKTLARRLKSVKSKSVARNTKKIMGNEMRSRRVELMGDERVEGLDTSVEDGNGIDKGGSGSGSGMDGLELFEGEDDIYVGIGDSPV
ncbi:uncharacterized protein Pyn_38948 [Prunus yedoensis var. nudiflora]|uniref:Zinc beta-ribbon domain-containing protein n=1 Tax=Prunus yedoensis var. nudiflora TaxID=2094558 RepID=A0A314ZED4_PRUYE|nr:uncharacterized protein Pyn_38948 [Prunus yedoensis var. nudiflora]